MQIKSHDDKRHRLGWVPNSKGDSRDDDTDTIPKDENALRAWLRKYKAWLETLEDLQSQFLETRDVTLLDQFADTFEPQKVKLKNLKDKPVALLDQVNFLEGAREHGCLAEAEDRLKEMKEDIKILFPYIEVREAETVDGEKLLAFVGATWKELSPAVELRREQRRIAMQIECGTQRLALITSGQASLITSSKDADGTPSQPIPPEKSAKQGEIRR